MRREKIDDVVQGKKKKNPDSIPVPAGCGDLLAGGPQAGAADRSEPAPLQARCGDAKELGLARLRLALQLGVGLMLLALASRVVGWE